MSETDFVLIFDLDQAGHTAWIYAVYGLIIVALGLVMVIFPRPVSQMLMMARRPRFFRILSWVWLVFAGLWTVAVAAGTYLEYRLVSDAYSRGDYATVVGPVENVVSSEGLIDEETFTVAGFPFRLLAFMGGPGYSTTRAEGGPIADGVPVRIAHVGDHIVRLEVARSALDEAAQSRASTQSQTSGPRSPGSFLVLPRYAWMVGVAFICLTALGWRLRGRKHIRNNPALRKGYNRLTSGLAYWGSLPFLMMGLMIEVGGDRDLSFTLDGAHTSNYEIATLLAFGLVDGLWIYWIFFRGGARKIRMHPGLIDHEWVAKAWPILIVGAQVVTAFVDLSNLFSFG